MKHFYVLVEFGLAFHRELNFSIPKAKSLKTQAPNISISRHFSLFRYSQISHPYNSESWLKSRKMNGFLLANVQMVVSYVILGQVKLDSVNANVKKRVTECYALVTFLSKAEKCDSE